MPWMLIREKQISVIHHLAEGNSIRATSRLCRVHRNTIMDLLTSFGPGCNHFMDLSFGNLNLNHLQIDEIWTFVGKKQAKLTDKEKATNKETGDIYLFIALDEETKLIPAARRSCRWQCASQRRLAASSVSSRSRPSTA